MNVKKKRTRRTKDQIAFEKAMEEADAFNASPEGQAQLEAIEKEAQGAPQRKNPVNIHDADLPF